MKTRRKISLPSRFFGVISNRCCGSVPARRSEAAARLAVTAAREGTGANPSAFCLAPPPADPSDVRSPCRLAPILLQDNIFVAGKFRAAMVPDM
jgi:hypothetical protein